MDIRENSKIVINHTSGDISKLPVFSGKEIVIYEVVRLINGKILFFQDHLERFFSSFELARLKTQLTKEEITSQIKLLINSNSITDGNILFQVLVNSETCTSDFLTYFIPHSYPTQEMYENGVAVSVKTASRTNPNAKIQQKELRTVTNEVIKKEKVYEVILVHPDGYVTEGSRSNLFMIKNGAVYTSDTKDILPGITRKYVIECIDSLHIPLFLGRISPEEMLDMDAIFISGTSPKILPVKSIGEKSFNPRHPVLRSLMLHFDKLIENHLDKL